MPSSIADPRVRASKRLGNVRYEIRGELTRRAHELEAQGRPIIKLNIGNPGLFGFETPEHLRRALAENLANSDAYCHQRGLPQAREAIAAHQRRRGATGANAQQVFVGNGVSELIDLCLRGLLDNGDEVLLPSPDYPLWSAATVLNDGVPRYYHCPAQRGHLPDPDEIEALIGPRTRALVVINPNNPTGAVYPRELLQALVEVAHRHRLVLLSDEIYDGIVYDGAQFVPLAALAGDVACVTFGGLSKMYRACGWRVGWISMSGAPAVMDELAHALDLLAALRLCANVPGQWAIAPALTGPDSSAPLTAPGGRLHEARRIVMQYCAQSEFLDLAAPRGALYAFPSIRAAALPEFDDCQFALELLEHESILIVPGTGFNMDARNHFRMTLLPPPDQLHAVFAGIESVLARQVMGGPLQRHVA
ncbi:MAG TPA: aminotransferase class I/II-fold pyridoxal phosphate-dependent enzyme [Rudaea sp.]|nr:aminotransferase class I/II-fold pyridoxal phosphate-dependent enzyme [Rudaea sp.]